MQIDFAGVFTYTVNMDAKTEFNKAALAGAFASGKPLNFDDIRMLSGMSQFLRDYAEKSGEFRCPMHIRAEAAVMDDEFDKVMTLYEEVKDYISDSEISFIEYLAKPKMFASPKDNENNLKEAKRRMDKLIKDAREKKARAEQAAKEEAEYQKRKAESRQTRAEAPVPDVKPLPAMGKVLKKDEEDDLYSGAGSRKKAGKRK